MREAVVCFRPHCTLFRCMLFKDVVTWNERMLSVSVYVGPPKV